MVRRDSSVAVMGLAAAVLLAAAWVTLATSISAHAGSSRRGVVLGSKKFAGPYGKGFGTVKPRTIYNGGDLSGLVRHIHWHHWGQKTSRGRGLTHIFRPQGGYYRKAAPIQLKALNLGRCPGSSRRAYRKLTFRVPKTPNGPIHGHWLSWSGRQTLCKYGFGALAHKLLAMRSCGTLPRGSIWQVAATPNVRCRKARYVVFHAARGHPYVRGFHCHEYRRGQYGVVRKCHHGSTKRIRGRSSV